MNQEKMKVLLYEFFHEVKGPLCDKPVHPVFPLSAGFLLA